MPTEGWFMQTSGSARKKVISNQGSNTSPNYIVSGVPRHTHNTSALISLDADYTQVRTEAATLEAGAWSYDELPLLEGMLADSVPIADEDERFERVIERCVGYITMAPENCQSFIREPTRSVSEIRTLVAPKTRLDTLTYVEELGGLRVPSGAQGGSTALGSEFPDVSVSLTKVHKVGSIKMEPWIYAGDSFQYKVSGAEPVGHAAVILSAAGEPVWDGTLTYRWDRDARQYYSLPLTVKIHSLDEYSQVAVPVRAHPAETYTVATAKYVHFPEHRTSVADGGFCWICEQDAAGVFSMGELSHAGLQLASSIPCILRGARKAGPYRWVGVPAQRVPVGGTEAFPGPSNFPLTALPVPDGRRFWDMLKAYPANIYEYSRRLRDLNGVNGTIADAAAVAAGIANNTRPYVANPFDLNARQISVYGMLPKLKPGGIQTTALAGVTLGNEPSIPRKRAGVLITVGGQGPGQEIPNEPVHFRQPISFTTANALASIEAAKTFAVTAGLGQAAVDALWVAAAGANPAGLMHGVGLVEALEPLQDPRTTSNTITFTNIQANVPVAGLNAQNAESDSFIIIPYMTRAYRMIPDAIHQNPGFPAALLPYREGFFKTTPNAADGAFASQTTAILARVHNVTNVAGQSWGFSATYEIPEAMRSGRTTLDFAEPENNLTGVDVWNSINFALGHNPVTAVPRGADHEYIYQGEYYPWYQNFNPALAQNAFVNLGTQTTAGSLFPYNENWGIRNAAGSAIIILNLIVGDPNAKVWARFGPALGNDDLQGPATPAYRLDVEKVFLGVSGNADQARWWTAFRVYQQDGTTDNEVRATYATINGYKTGNAQVNRLTLNVFTQTQSASFDRLNTNVAALREAGQSLGAVFQSKKRISQHVCAPLVNPNMRIGATAPLNHDSRHLPPEMRDFQMHFDTVDWGRLGLPSQSDSNPTLNALTLYNFDGGVQQQTENPSLLYLPRFVEHKQSVEGLSFEFECYSDRGSPGFYAVFCRKSSTDLLQQPRILSLTIFNDTTKRKSNVITDCSMSELYHLTQRNVHPEAHYDRKAYDRRQTILLSAEDVGMMGFQPHEYQKQKRARYIFSGTLNEPGDVYVIFVFNNRGLHIDGRNIGIVNLHQ